MLKISIDAVILSCFLAFSPIFSMTVGKKRENIAFSKLEQSWKHLKLVNNHHVEIQTIQKMTDKEKQLKN